MFNIGKMKKSLCTALFLSLMLSGTVFAAPGTVTIKAPSDGIDINVYKIGERQGDVFIPDDGYSGLSLDFSENDNEIMAKAVSAYISKHDVKADISESTKNERLLLEEPDEGIYFVMLSENEEDVLMTPFIFEIPGTDSVTGNNGRFFEVYPKFDDQDSSSGDSSHQTDGGFSGIVSNNKKDETKPEETGSQSSTEAGETGTNDSNADNPQNDADGKESIIHDIMEGLTDTGDHSDIYLYTMIISGCFLIAIIIYTYKRGK